MNILIAKRASLFSLILGALIGLISLVPMVIGLSLFTLAFLCSPIVILYMKKNEKYLGIITNEQGAILGAIIGFCAAAGFFASFSPLVCVLHFIFKSYYAYAIPDMFSMGLWLFFVILIMVGIIFAMTNSVSAMGISWLLGHTEKKPENYDAPLNIEIED